MKSDDAKKIIDFLHQSEKLKSVLRHSWLSSGRREDVAEHTWRMALMAMLLEPYLDDKVDLLKTIKMILVHDLVEINYKDNPAFKKQPADKAEQERKSMIKLVASLPAELKDELLTLWEEYEVGSSPEARFAKAMDKTEVLLQHNECDLKYLTKKEIPYNFVHGLEHIKYDSFLRKFRRLMDNEVRANYKKNKIDPELYREYLKPSA